MSGILNTKKVFNIKWLILLLILLGIALTPIFSSADEGQSRSTFSHGHLEINAGNVILPFGSVITESEIINLANPSAVHSYQVQSRGLVPVTASYSISPDSVKKINDIQDAGEKIWIEIEGIYMYHCSVPPCNVDVPSPVSGTAKIAVMFKPSSLNITFNGNGGKVDGQSTKSITIPYTNKSGVAAGADNMPESVKKKNATFRGWSTSQNQFIGFSGHTIITGDTVVYAHWSQTKGKEEKEEGREHKPLSTKDDDIDNMTKTRNYLIASAENSDQSDESEEDAAGAQTFSSENIAKAEFLSLAEAGNVPVATIGQGSVPLYSPSGYSGWACINLIMAIGGAVMALICFIVSLRQGRNKKSLWFAFSIIAGMAGLLLFFITENTNLNMVLTDKWTAVNGIFFLVVVISIISFFRKKEDVEEFIYDY